MEDFFKGVWGGLKIVGDIIELDVPGLIKDVSDLASIPADSGYKAGTGKQLITHPLGLLTPAKKPPPINEPPSEEEDEDQPAMMPIQTPVSFRWDYHYSPVPIYDDGKKYTPGLQKINKYTAESINPTFSHPGF